MGDLDLSLDKVARMYQTAGITCARLKNKGELKTVNLHRVTRIKTDLKGKQTRSID